MEAKVSDKEELYQKLLNPVQNKQLFMMKKYAESLDQMQPNTIKIRKGAREDIYAWRVKEPAPDPYEHLSNPLSFRTADFSV